MAQLSWYARYRHPTYTEYAVSLSKFIFWWSTHPLNLFNSYNKSLKVLLPAKHTLSSIKVHLKVPSRIYLRVLKSVQTVMMKKYEGSSWKTHRWNCTVYLFESLNTFKKASLDINKSQFGKFFCLYLLIRFKLTLTVYNHVIQYYSECDAFLK